MNFNEQLVQFSKDSYAQYVPHVSVDTVIFGFNEGEMKVLLLKMNFNKQWFLPGGYVGKDENVDAAAKRVLLERAGAQGIFLEEFAIFGDVNRNESSFEGFPNDLWQKMRFISIGYYALVNYTEVIPQPDQLSELCEWVDFSKLSELSLTMDHRRIIDKALLTLRERLSYKPIGYNLLPAKFTLPELQRLYEVVLGRKLNRGNFYRKMKNMNILTKLDEQRKGGAHKAPDLYSFDLDQYNRVLADGLANW